MISEHLGQLETSGLIRLAQLDPELEYLFRHALVQDAAYDSLLVRDRRQLHRRVGEALERLYPDRLNVLSPVLAQHFYNAGDDEHALKYFTLAGDAALRVYANVEAASHYAHALAIAERTHALSDALLHLFTSRGRALELDNQHEQAWQNYRAMEAAARERGERDMELSALLALATLCTTPNPLQDVARGEALLGQALNLARESGDRAAQSRILWNKLLLCFYTSYDNEQAVSYGEQSLAIARELNLRVQMAFTLNDLVRAYSAAGHLARALEASEEADALWRELGNMPMRVDNLTGAAYAYKIMGRYEQTIEMSDQAYQIARSIGNIWGQATSCMTAGQSYIELGQFGQAIAMIEESIALAEQARHMVVLTDTRAQLGLLYGSLGDSARGVQLIEQARVEAEKMTGEVGNLQHILEFLARLYLLQGNRVGAETIRAKLEQPRSFTMLDIELALSRQAYAQALAAVEERLDILYKSGAHHLVPEALYFKGRVLLEQGQLEAAQAALAEACELAESYNARRILWRILAALSEIEMLHGNHAKAQSLRQQAGEIVAYIADHIDRPELRASFLNLPDVATVLGKSNGDPAAS